MVLDTPGKLTGPCSYTEFEKGADAVFGMSLVNAVRSTVRSNVNVTKTPFDEPKNLVRLPETMDPLFTVDGWRADVNGSFEPPKLAEVFDAGKNMRRAVFERNAANDDTRRRRRHGREAGDDRAPADNDNDRATIATVHESLQRFMDGVVGLFKDEEFLRSLAVSSEFNASIYFVRKFCLKLLGTLQPLLTKNLTTLIEMSFSKSVLRTTALGMARSIIVKSAVHTVGKTAVLLAKTTVQATSVLGWVLLAATVLDTVFSTWDPYGYRNMFAETAPADMMRRGEDAMRREFKLAAVDYDFDEFVGTVLTDNERISLQIQSFTEIAIYLDSLDVNSSGQVIDRDDTIRISSDDRSKYDLEASLNRSYARSLVKLSTFDRNDYDNYNGKFLRRVAVNGTCNKIVIGVTVGVLASVFLGVHLITFLCALVLVAVLALNRHTVTDDTFIKLHDLVSRTAIVD
ncbi:hypothetical protein AGLY_017569 [Aphis glycines]|uniref:P74 n=1 Tax=Aphis glycines TaxID=307491 RepID=A0A6G0SUQ9_APHGL|nr:hypothetical protein AGLY_017569 [Aphis glycines]